MRQKEALKALRAEVDVLTLTATPIPRTLGMSLEGLRDFSVIATAPQNGWRSRPSSRAFPTASSAKALLREFKRGGQVYFLHNEVDTIENMRDKLTKLCPEARIVVGHGQMNERELERVMRDFTSNAPTCCCARRSSKPASTTRTPTPSSSTAPTSSASRSCTSCAARRRSHHQAYAYLLTPWATRRQDSGLTKQAKQRLEAIQMMDELGAGFISPCTTSKSAAPAKCSAKTSRAKCGNRLQPVLPKCSTAPSRAASKARTGPAAAARHRHRNQPAHAGAAAQRLRAGRA